MPTPKSGYYVDGVRVPSVTTIIKACKSSEALIYWSWNIAYQPYQEVRAMLEKIISQGGLDSGTVHDARAILEKPDPDYRAKRDKAADVGTIVHARIECQTKGLLFDPTPYISPSIPDPMSVSEAGFEAFKLWSTQTHFALEPAEMQLTSGQYKFGGTPDQIMVINEKRSVGDYKSGNLYPDSLLPQLAAYQYLLRENGYTIDDDGAHAMSINKDTGGFTHRYFTPQEIQNGWEAFKLMRQLYEIQKYLK